MGRGSDRSLIGKVMTNYMECPMRGEGWSLEIDVPPHAMLIPVWDEWKISLESSRYMPAADQPGLALCRKKQKSQSNAGKKTDFLAWRSLRKKVLWKRFKIVRAPLAACEYIAAVVTVIPFPPERKFTSVPRTTAWSGCWCRIFRPFPGNSPVSSDLPWWKISVNYQRI